MAFTQDLLPWEAFKLLLMARVSVLEKKAKTLKGQQGRQQRHQLEQQLEKTQRQRQGEQLQELQEEQRQPQLQQQCENEVQPKEFANHVNVFLVRGI